MTGQVPLGRIVTLRAAVRGDLDRRGDHPNLPGPNGPEWVVEIDPELTVTSPYRRDRAVRSVGLRLEQPERPGAALEPAAPASGPKLQ